MVMALWTDEKPILTEHNLNHPCGDGICDNSTEDDFSCEMDCVNNMTYMCPYPLNPKILKAYSMLEGDGEKSIILMFFIYVFLFLITCINLI